MEQFLKSQRVLTPDGLRPACIAFENGGTISVDPYLTGDAGETEYCILPGLVDTHVHVNEPGRTHWEGFETATRAAAAGGITCIVDMPLNAIPATTTVDALQRKREAAAGQCRVDCEFWGGVVPGNAGELLALAEKGVRGFKCFLSDSGVPEFQRVDEADLRAAMPIIAQTGLPLLVHAELPQYLRSPVGDRANYRTYLESRPPEAEVEAVRLMIRLCRETRCRVHIVHVSAAKVLPLLSHAKAEGLPVTAETCPHYLYFAAEDIADNGTRFKCAPPIRSAANRDLLWEGLRDGTLDLIATDHSPCPPDLKAGDFSTAWGGIASLSVALSAVWTQARKRGFTLEHIARWMSTNPAHLAGLSGKKGQIAPGCDADFVLFDPDASFQVTPERLHFRHPISPYVGEGLMGQVREVFVRGQCVQ